MGVIYDLPELERPREKLLKNGVKSLSSSELIAIVIGSGTRNCSALDLAHQILSMDKTGLPFFANCQPEELYKIKGVGLAKACTLVAAVELGIRVLSTPKDSKCQITNPKDISRLFMDSMKTYKKEVFKLLLLNTKNEVIMTDEISIGNLNSAIVHPREVFNNPIKKSAASIILIHNHPSGNPEPSVEDIDLTKRIVEVGKIIGISVLDHIIIGDGTYKSLKELSLI